MFVKKVLTEEDKERIQERLEEAFFTLDIYSEVEIHTPTKLTPARSGKQATGACPYDDCPGDDDGFIVWRELTPRGKHYMCRTCRRSGHILKLVMDIKNLSFSAGCTLLGIPNPYLDPGQGVPTKKSVRPTPRQDNNSRAEEEVETLLTLYPRMQKALLHYERARLYLTERAIPFDLAVSLGLGYIPPLVDVTRTPELEKFSKWCDRIVFPLHTPDGKRGFTARSLAYWTPGMDEDKHKEVLKAHNINRYETTTPAGYFNWQAVGLADSLTFVEGPFDALACIACGINNTIPIGTTGVPIDAIPTKICDVIMALDTDDPGLRAASKLAKEMRRKGITVTLCMPALGNDWSEAYRLHGTEGLGVLLEADRERQTVMIAPAPGEPGVQEQVPTDYSEANAQLPDWLLAEIAQIVQPCFTCLSLDPPAETPAVGCYGDNMYCTQHMPAQESTVSSDPLDDPVVKELVKLFGGQVEVLSADVGGQQASVQVGDYWTMLEQKLAHKGYDKAFKATEQRLLNLEIPPRVYPAPFPEYGIREDGSFGVVGMFGCNPGEHWTMEEWALRK